MGEALERAKAQYKSELSIRGVKFSPELMESLLEPLLEAACQEGFDYGRYEYKLYGKGCTPATDEPIVELSKGGSEDEGRGETQEELSETGGSTSEG